ncbi:MAG: AAA family ATPase [Euryarchaeota archaeon RBG_16_68_12]|nr:MAG: AAA family ATPase [Euryarchaeota archaeon RBG_16_68_12]
MKEEEKFLRVLEAKSPDVGRGVVRVDPELMRPLKLSDGDAVVIEGRRKTAAMLAAGLPEDANRGVIRMDGILRRNAQIGIDEKVGVRVISPRQAEKLTLAPTEPVKIMGGEAYLAQALDGRLVTRGDLVSVPVMGRRFEFVVQSFGPTAEAVEVSASTKVKIAEKPAKQEETKIPRVSYEDIGGLGTEVSRVREMIELPLRHPELFDRLGVEAPKGVLLHGPPGTGKTLLARAVASETNANFHAISGPEIMSKFYGQSEENLREIFQQAQENAPSIIFIDEIDSIAPKRDEVSGEVERRVVAQLLALMDGLQARGKVVVIGATNRPNSLDPAIRRPGRFDREIEIGIPGRDGRFEVLQIHARNVPLAKDVDLKALADVTHGYVGADLAALVKEAAMRSLRRVLPDIDLEVEEIPVEVLRKLEVTRDDFLSAFREMEPSTLREVLIERPDVRWDDIGGLDGPKQELREAVEWPLKYANLFTQAGAKAPKGVLLYGPPGTGKTLLAKAVATESEANFISVKGPEFLSKWVGESERAVRETFRKAKAAAPCVIFFDEIDAVTPLRGLSADTQVTERVISQILTEMDGLEELHNVTIIAATNRPDLVDPALLRPGRFDRLVYTPPPDLEARRGIFGIHAKGKPLAPDVKLDDLARRTEDYTGAEIAAVCNEAAMLSIRDFVAAGGSLDDKAVKKLTLRGDHFERALQKIRPRSKDEIRRYKGLSTRFREGMEVA